MKGLRFLFSKQPLTTLWMSASSWLSTSTSHSTCRLSCRGFGIDFFELTMTLPHFWTLWLLGKEWSGRGGYKFLLFEFWWCWCLNWKKLTSFLMDSKLLTNNQANERIFEIYLSLAYNLCNAWKKFYINT